MTPAGTSNELDVQNGWEENTHTHGTTTPFECGIGANSTHLKAMSYEVPRIFIVANAKKVWMVRGGTYEYTCVGPAGERSHLLLISIKTRTVHFWKYNIISDSPVRLSQERQQYYCTVFSLLVSEVPRRATEGGKVSAKT